MPPRVVRIGVQFTSSAVLAGLYISLNQCSMSPGLEYRLAGVIISRQMNPRPTLT